jgi:1-acyl-sn-glycerol-3-phosphate acyltransferase
MRIGPLKVDLKMPSPVRSALQLYGRVMYPIVRAPAEPILRRMFGMHPEGLEHVPRTGPAIVTPNHLGIIDPLFVAMAIQRRIVFIGKAEYWNAWQTRWLMEIAGGIPVERDDSVKAHGSLEAGTEVLRRGELLGIFPEGTRSPDGRLFKGKTGAARMALEVGCPVIPAGLIGTEAVLPKGATVPRLVRVKVKFGRPKYVPEEAREDAHLLRVFTDEVMRDIAELTGQTYRNRYSYQKRRGSVDAPVAISFGN